MPLFLLSLLIGALFGYAFVLLMARRKPPYVLHQEYWVYLPGDTMPEQDEVMKNIVSGDKPVSPGEALLFSDVRLHIALVLRSKNGHVFRPDLLAPAVDATPQQLDVLERAQSLAKVRYVSEERVHDRRHLTFLPQLAHTIARLGGGQLVYDPIGERLVYPEELRGGDPGPNVRWVPAASGGHVETLGLKKLGLAEIRTAPVAVDERWIVTEIVEQVAWTAWKKGELPPTAEAEAFDDRFRVDLTVGRDGVALARVHRIQAVR